MNLKQLRKFCADESDPRPQIRKPFTQGNYTYATNAHIIIRVPKIRGVKVGVSPKVEDVGDWKQEGRWNIGKYFPNTKLERCPHCGADNAKVSTCGVEIGVNKIQNKYLDLLNTLPGCQYIPARLNRPIPFVFQGGCGYVMTILTERK